MKHYIFFALVLVAGITSTPKCFADQAELQNEWKRRSELFEAAHVPTEAELKLGQDWFCDRLRIEPDDQTLIEQFSTSPDIKLTRDGNEYRGRGIWSMVREVGLVQQSYVGKVVVKVLDGRLITTAMTGPNFHHSTFSICDVDGPMISAFESK